jgi:hypothetical protein
MVGMAYLYFSRLNKESSYNETSLYAATANSGLVFCLQNDRSIFEILKGQNLFEHLLGEEKFNQLLLLKTKVVANSKINNMIANKDIFISFSSAKSKQIDFLISTQLNNEAEQTVLVETLKSSGIQTELIDRVTKLRLNDSTSFYLSIEKNLLLLSSSILPVKKAALKNIASSSHDFMAYIKSNNKRSKNSVANLYIDFNKLPALIKAILPVALHGNLALFNKQNTYASLSYNFSKERLFFNGTSRINDPDSYFNLFNGLKPQKSSIDNLLPTNTANYTLYATSDYKTWRTALQQWFTVRKEYSRVKKIIASTKTTYRLDPEKIFPAYFSNQMISFQLKSAEQLGAINLSNGDKVKQLLIDISDDYNQDIKRLKVSGLLYCYFGEPFKKFSTPYYTVIDNHLVFSNQANALERFLKEYRSNNLLISESDYINLFSQISNTANVTFYANHQNSTDLVRNAVYLPYYQHFLSTKNLGKFSSLLYQLSGDQGTFQTSLLMNTIPENITGTADSTLTITQIP